MVWIFFLLVSFLSVLEAQGQSVSFDYRITAVRMYEIEPESGQQHQIEDLAPYLYDIGPRPKFVFEVDIEQLEGSSPLARRVELKVERYLLLEAGSDSTYRGLKTTFPDLQASTAWSYHGPVPLQFTRTPGKKSIVTFTSAPYQIEFLDPDNPITFARPIGYKILGFAYRFAIISRSVNQRDKNLLDNALQLEFLRP